MSEQKLPNENTTPHWTWKPDAEITIPGFLYEGILSFMQSKVPEAAFTLQINDELQKNFQEQVAKGIIIDANAPKAAPEEQPINPE